MTVFIDSFDKEEIKWVDARFDLHDVASGKAMYEAGHVEGAVYWDLEKDMSDMAAAGGRHPLPSDEQLTALISRSGLQPEDYVVVYDQGGAPYAARAWWLLKYAGFRHVFISKDGFEELQKKGIKTSTEVPAPQPSEPVLQFNREISAAREDVEKVVSGEKDAALLDARSEGRYRGIEEPIDPIAGRIPGARNFDWSQLVEEGRFIDQPDFTGVLLPQEEAIVYCGSGVTAAALYAMLTEAGHEKLSLYTGSFSDWIADAAHPVEFDRPEHPAAADDATKALLGRLIAEGYSGEMLMKKFEYEKSLLDQEK